MIMTDADIDDITVNDSDVNNSENKPKLAFIDDEQHNPLYRVLYKSGVFQLL